MLIRLTRRTDSHRSILHRGLAPTLMASCAARRPTGEKAMNYDYIRVRPGARPGLLGDKGGCGRLPVVINFRQVVIRSGFTRT